MQTRFSALQFWLSVSARQNMHKTFLLSVYIEYLIYLLSGSSIIAEA